MKIPDLLLIGTVFLLGFLSGVYIISSNHKVVELPLNNFGFYNFSFDKAPPDFVSEDKIQVYDDRVVIFVEGASLSRYAPTGSMVPVFDERSNGLRVKVRSVDDVNVGDIISFKKNGDLIVHRVIEKGEDEKGVYFTTKGDNNNISDGKIRIENIEYKTIGVIW